MKVKVKLLHDCPIPGARWCEPIGWEPANEIKGAVYEDGAWWDDHEEVASLIWLGEPNQYGAFQGITVPLDDLRVATAGECRVLEKARCGEAEHGAMLEAEEAEELLVKLSRAVAKWAVATDANRKTATVEKEARATLARLYAALTGDKLSEEGMDDIVRQIAAR